MLTAAIASSDLTSSAQLLASLEQSGVVKSVVQWTVPAERIPDSANKIPEIVFLDLGFLLSLYSAYRIACMQASQSASVWKAMVPWACLIVVLFAVGVWIVLQPMQMRGTLVGVG